MPTNLSIVVCWLVCITLYLHAHECVACCIAAVDPVGRECAITKRLHAAVSIAGTIVPFTGFDLLFLLRLVLFDVCYGFLHRKGDVIYNCKSPL